MSSHAIRCLYLVRILYNDSLIQRDNTNVYFMKYETQTRIYFVKIVLQNRRDTRKNDLVLL